MLVCANNGNFPADNTEQLSAALNAACGEIWLGEGTDGYPRATPHKDHLFGFCTRLACIFSAILHKFRLTGVSPCGGGGA